jgi:hypothetical protein
MEDNITATIVSPLFQQEYQKSNSILRYSLYPFKNSWHLEVHF